MPIEPHGIQAAEQHGVINNALTSESVSRCTFNLESRSCQVAEIQYRHIIQQLGINKQAVVRNPENLTDSDVLLQFAPVGAQLSGN